MVLSILLIIVILPSIALSIFRGHWLITSGWAVALFSQLYIILLICGVWR